MVVRAAPEVRGPADGACGTDVRCGRGRVDPGCTDGSAGAIDVGGTSSVAGGGAGEVVPIVDSPGRAGCTGSGGPTRWPARKPATARTTAVAAEVPATAKRLRRRRTRPPRSITSVASRRIGGCGPPAAPVRIARTSSSGSMFVTSSPSVR
ncbi:hypothetical protein DV20_39335 [Amycolatopsis rifamycinica]|uniref:Uncharacterized protein n=1 Tax=Amycolatopsis rifamycinica TaxID=287986 RepID=A0A066TSR7_9PSEU|nr:hypothetical protein DV20_39335 [Amycolatopsis rifamycinica]